MRSSACAATEMETLKAARRKRRKILRRVCVKALMGNFFFNRLRGDFNIGKGKKRKSANEDEKNKGKNDLE